MSLLNVLLLLPLVLIRNVLKHLLLLLFNYLFFAPSQLNPQTAQYSLYFVLLFLLFRLSSGFQLLLEADVVVALVPRLLVHELPFVVFLYFNFFFYLYSSFSFIKSLCYSRCLLRPYSSSSICFSSFTR